MINKDLINNCSILLLEADRDGCLNSLRSPNDIIDVIPGRQELLLLPINKAPLLPTHHQGS